jgi:2-polyprenyl-3-methyl-5-hydroxy-6-metoxy-1,4-benzoquinol methylase
MRPRDWNLLAKNYHKEIISPFQKGVKNSLFRELEKVKYSRNKIIADIGCGRGEILDILASRFKKVYAIDFSPVMINIAKKLSRRKNIEYVVKDMRHLSAFKNKFDVVVSINSVMMPEIKDVKKALRSIHSSLKKDGIFLGIFPSMDSILYQGFLILEEQIEKYGDEKRAIKNTKRILERKKYNFIKGTYNDEGKIQKFYYDFELKIRLRDVGFRNIVLSKVLYPWGTEISDFIDFPGKPKMWDWFVVARK